MSDDKTITETEPTTPPPLTPDPPTTPEGEADDKTYSAEYVRELRRYEKDYKEQIANLQKQVKGYETEQSKQQRAADEAEKAKLAEQQEWQKLAEKAQSESETLAQRVSELEASIVEAQRKALAQSIATSLGAANPDDLNFLNAVLDIDMSAADAEAQAKTSLEAMKETHVYLFNGDAPAQSETPNKPKLTSFNPSGSGVQQTDAQRIERLRRLTGQGQTFGSS